MTAATRRRLIRITRYWPEIVAVGGGVSALLFACYALAR